MLEKDDGNFLTESLTIIDYLEEVYPEGALLGNEPESRSNAKQLERIVELNVFGPIGQYVHATNSPLGLPPDAKRASEIEKSMMFALTYLEELLGDGRECLMGNRVNVADCTLQAAFQFARFGKAKLIADYPNLNNWDQRYRNRLAAKEVLKF